MRGSEVTVKATVDGTIVDSGSSTRTKILAYLGQLKPEEFISAKRLCYDLALRFTTAKNTLTLLEERGLVTKLITSNKGVVASFKIASDAGKYQPRTDGAEGMRFVPYVPPEWSDAYGRHPYAP